MNIAEWLSARANLSPRSPALMTGLRVDADYAIFARRAGGIAAGLRDRHGIGAGGRVAIFTRNRTKYRDAL